RPVTPGVAGSSPVRCAIYKALVRLKTRLEENDRKVVFFCPPFMDLGCRIAMMLGALNLSAFHSSYSAVASARRRLLSSRSLSAPRGANKEQA
ncbi:hypothetical protein, partial [Aquipseudomonas alcaligenes]|uniref:hypothetical protein n=1 Tax=Aquipseudomonas alcaligenes TaxID=43263 RepID=UPI0024311495